ncbi:MAG: hypothetical protein V1757_05210 [Actinomycetota bacterium]
MIRRFYELLPGPAAVRIAQMVLAVAVLVVLVALFYEWVGSTFFDSGGVVG